MTERNDAFTGLEAALVLIAFVVVAAVFSYVVLSAGFFTIQKSQSVIYSAVEQGSSTMIVGENILGLRNSTTGNIDRIRLSVGSPYALMDIDLKYVTIHFMTSDLLRKLNRADPFFSEAEPSPGTWRIISNTEGENFGSILSTGNYVTIMINLPSDMQVKPGQDFRINILPPLGAPLSVDRTAPESMTETVFL